ncbi:MAG TPA: helix-turn-helix domain-containing protein [Steroidobacteraceae bacterium]|jgi:AcrR family transcriptional regulator
MPRPPKKRAYDSSTRRAAAQLTRHSILENARRLFLENGYAATTMPAVARAADVALDTVYATVGTKAQLFRLLVEAALSGQDTEVRAQERDYVRAIHAEPNAARKLQIYASALSELQPRLAPLFQVLQAAAPLDADLKALWQEISRRRAANMRLLADNLVATGQVRGDLAPSRVADVLWSLNSPELYLLLVDQRGWRAEDFGLWLGEAWRRLLLEP